MQAILGYEVFYLPHKRFARANLYRHKVWIAMFATALAMIWVQFVFLPPPEATS